jgi:hypothetical protein
MNGIAPPRTVRRINEPTLLPWYGYDHRIDLEWIDIRCVGIDNVDIANHRYSSRSVSLHNHQDRFCLQETEGRPQWKKDS